MSVASPHARRVIVVGGGPAGCTAAHRLRQRSHEVLLLEAAPRLGGRTWTLRHDGFTIDTGAFYVGHFYERTLALLEELGMRASLVPMERTGGLHDGRRIVPWSPASPLSIARLPETPWHVKARAFAVLTHAALVNVPDAFDLDELADADDGRTVTEWARRLLGETGCRRVALPTFEPYWLYDARDAVSLMLTVFLQHTPKLQLFALPRGTGSLCEALAGEVDVELATPAAGLRVGHDGVAVETAGGSLERADGVVLACDARAAAEILRDGPVADALAAVPYAANAHVSSAYRVGADRFAGLPATVHTALPREEPALTVSLLSRKAPGLVPAGWELVDVYFGERVSRTLEREQAARLAHERTQALLGVDLPPASFAHVFDRERAIVKPPPGHFGRMRAALGALPPRVALAGDYLSAGIVEAAVRSGERAAERLDAALGALPRASHAGVAAP